MTLTALIGSSLPVNNVRSLFDNELVHRSELAIAANVIDKKVVDCSLRALLRGQVRAVLIIVPNDDSAGIDQGPHANRIRHYVVVNVAAINVRQIKSTALRCQPIITVLGRSI